jgi:succinyl-diaminopimelate desuccinylase
LTIPLRNAIDRQEATDLLVKMLQIPTVNPPGKEKQLAEFIHDWSRTNGLDAELDEKTERRPNVYVSLKGSSKDNKLLFNGHLDVVPEGSGWSHPPFGGTIVGDRVYGRGACDMKAGLAAALIAAKNLAQSEKNLDGCLLIEAVIDEEGPGKGTRQTLEKGLVAENAIVCEPTSLKVVTASKGDLDVEITVSGTAAHSSVPEKGVNAIYKTMDIIEEIRRYADNLREGHRHPLLDYPTVSVDVIEGGTSPWVVPEACKIVVDRRTLPGENRESVLGELESLVERLKMKDPELIVTMKEMQFDTPAEISQDEPIVKIIAEEYKAVTGQPAQVGGLTGTTDARFLINDLHIPAVIFGPGDLALAHKPDEYVPLSEYYDAAQIYAGIALRLLGQ